MLTNPHAKLREKNSNVARRGHLTTQLWTFLDDMFLFQQSKNHLILLSFELAEPFSPVLRQNGSFFFASFDEADLLCHLSVILQAFFLKLASVNRLPDSATGQVGERCGTLARIQLISRDLASREINWDNKKNRHFVTLLAESACGWGIEGVTKR